MTYERYGIVERRAIIETSATGYRLINETGALLAEAEMGQDGSVTLLDRDCQVVQRWTSDQLWSIIQSHSAILDESEASPRRM